MDDDDLLGKFDDLLHAAGRGVFTPSRTGIGSSVPLQGPRSLPFWQVAAEPAGSE